MTRTGRSPRLGQHIAEPFAEIHPADAEARGIGPADLVEVTSPHGRALVRALVTDRVQPGSDLRPDALVRRVRLAAPASTPWCPPRPTRTPASPRSRPAAPRSAATPPPGTASPSAAAARRPATDYWAIAPTPFGLRAELADAARPDDWPSLARSLFAAPQAEAVLVEDRTRGTARVALVEDGRITAALFAAAEPVEVARAHVVAAFETDAPPMLLAGRPGAAQEDRGAIVCACFDVGINTIVGAIARGEATSVEAIGAVLKAGSNCGSCRPELKSLLATHAPKIAAE